MWFGTWYGGLARFDGYEFKVFQHEPRKPTSLAHNYVWTLLVDKTGTLWVGTNGGGLDRYDRRTESFIHFGYDSNDPRRLPHANIKVLFEDSQGRLWVGSNGGLSLLDRASNSFTTIKQQPGNPNSLAGNSVRTIIEERQSGVLWIGTRRNGLTLYNHTKKTFAHFRHDPNDPASLSDDAVQSILQDKSGRIWVATRNGLNRFDPATQTFQRYRHKENDRRSLSGNWVNKLYQDRLGRFWVGTRSGTNLYIPSTDSFERVTAYQRGVAETIDLSVNTVFEDTAGAIWFGIENGGVARLDRRGQRFHLLQGNQKLRFKDSIRKRIIRSVNLDRRGHLWIGYQQSGLDHYDGESYRTFQKLLKGPESLIDNHVTAISPHRADGLWIGTLAGLSRYDGQKFTHYVHKRNNGNSISGNNISALATDTHGGVWIGVHGKGVDYFDGKNFTRYSYGRNNRARFPSRYPQYLLPDISGSGVWVGGHNTGLVHIDRLSGSIETFLPQPRKPRSPLHNKVRQLARDADGLLWLATNTGVFAFDPKTKTFKRHLTSADGLLSNTIMNVSVDDSGKIWIASIRGLSQFDPVDGSVVNLHVSRDLFSGAFFPNTVSKDRNGRLYWGTAKGVLSLLPGKKTANSSIPPIVFTDLRVLDERPIIGKVGSALQSAITVADRVVIAPGVDNFAMTFAALDFSAPKKNKYAYMLEGYDRAWRQADASGRTARYKKVPPGEYILRAKGTNSDGVWNEQGAAIAISVLPFWWQTAWFRGGAVVAILSLIVLAFAVQRKIALRFRELAKFPDQSPHPVMRFDSNDRLIYSNDATQPLFDGHVLKPDGLAPDDWKAILEDVRENRGKSEALFDFEQCGLKMILSFSPLLASQNVDVHGHDVTDRRKAEEQLQQSQKMEAVGQLTSGIAHDFNNLLAVVGGNVDLVVGRLRQDGKSHELLKRALMAVDRGSRLTQRLLSFSRKQPLDPSPIDVDDLVQGMNDLFERTLGEKFQIELNTSKSLWVCEADASQLESALLNLVINARDAMPSGGVITIETRNVQLREDDLAESDACPPGDYILIAVTDTGSGMSREVLGRVFEPFFTTKQIGEGSGLGLSMVYGFAKQSGGHVSVDSQVDQGTVFRLYLPRSRSSFALDPMEKAGISADMSGQEKVLIVEDDPDVGLLAETILTNAKYQVTTARNGREALSLCTESQPELLVTDIVLPGDISGVDLAEQLKLKFPSLKVLFMTGYFDEADINGKTLGRDGAILRKPFRKRALLAKVRHALEKSN